MKLSEENKQNAIGNLTTPIGNDMRGKFEFELSPLQFERN